MKQEGLKSLKKKKKILYSSYFAAIKACAQLCIASINIVPVARLPFDMPVIEAAAKPLYDLCDFVKQLHQHGVPVSTSRTDAAGSRNYAATLGLLWSSSLSMRQHLQHPPPKPLETCTALRRAAAGRVRERVVEMCCGK